MRNKLLRKTLVIMLTLVLVFGIACLFHPIRRTVRIAAQTAIAHVYPTPKTSFPSIDTNSLSPLQQRIVVLASQEYAKQPTSYDATVLKYTQGNSEPWCADFASWIFMQAGRPFTNPNSGSWRIPGVYTLQAYFQTRHDYKTAATYTPKIGDVAIYHRGQGHTAIVITVKNGQMTTIGGNENGHLRIDTQSYAKNVNGLDGFGVLVDSRHSIKHVLVCKNHFYDPYFI